MIEMGRNLHVPSINLIVGKWMCVCVCVRDSVREKYD